MALARTAVAVETEACRAISEGFAWITLAYPFRTWSRADHHTSYHAEAPRPSQRSRNSATRARDRADNAPSEHELRYTLSWKIGNSERYCARAWARTVLA